jgi:(1->4)-alpha-D-glucan 1-alpha-D-glucosylmutase
MVVPRSTYRLQLQPAFGFDEAAGVVEYLRDLGVSHLYCSPWLKAARGSTHGYDVVDYHRVNDELGGEQGRQRLLHKVRECGLGQVLDIVPNHMAITGSENGWWWDTLENGISSRYAPYFDIEWNAPEERLRNKILLPVLEDHSGLVIESGKIGLERYKGGFLFRYYDYTFPAAPESMADILAGCATRCGCGQLGFLADSLAHLTLPPDPDWTGTRWDALAAHHRDKEAIRDLLERLCSDRPEVAKEIDSTVQALNNDPGLLDVLLSRQNYRLSRWHAAARDLGYRRFFDINSLVGIKTEDQRVFADTHQLILRWLRCGQLDGVRVDHPDGLRDPEEYFQRLRVAAPAAWIVAEKILQPGERIPASWAIAGTTGYDFLNLVNGLFVDPRGEAPLNEYYRAFTGETADFAAAVREKKALVLRDILGSDVNRLTALLVQICEDRRAYRDYTRHELHEAIREVITHYPVYRTYVRPGAGTMSEADAEIISQAVSAAGASRTDLETRLFQFLGDILMLRVQGPGEREFVMRFQQVTAAAMAKGVEDTACYSYLRLVSLNEVGGNPSSFGLPVDEFHKWCADTQGRWPQTMLATSTHDTKRSEDVRARIGLISEIPALWAETVSRWSSANARFRTGDSPDRKSEYLLYQTLIGAWPISQERLSSYMRKAVREAKEQTSWIQPNAAFESALDSFIDALLQDRQFVAELEGFLAPLVTAARFSSLAQNLLKLTAPGIPDIYQGMELWQLTLVDPDNRRSIDYHLRRQMLAELDGLSPEEILARSDEGMPKLWIIRQCLRVRNAQTEDFGAEGSYRALWPSGPKASYLVAFQRGSGVVVAAPRLFMSIGNWEETTLEVPEGSWKNQFTGDVVEGGKQEIGGLLKRFPVLLLTREAAA